MDGIGEVISGRRVVPTRTMCTGERQVEVIKCGKWLGVCKSEVIYQRGLTSFAHSQDLDRIHSCRNRILAASI
jgi:hypothetical protein